MIVETSPTRYQAVVGSAFQVKLAENADVALLLQSVKVRVDTDAQLVFSLTFKGPPLFLPQATYALSHPELAELHLFLVPIQQTADGFVYEAVFNLLKNWNPTGDDPAVAVVPQPKA